MIHAKSDHFDDSLPKSRQRPRLGVAASEGGYCRDEKTVLVLRDQDCKSSRTHRRFSQPLPRKMGERLVGVGHAVDVFLGGYGGAFALGGVEDFRGE